jgi:transposase
LLCDALGRPLRFLLTGGEKADCQSALPLLEQANCQPEAVIADKGYDSNAIRETLCQAKVKIVIPPRRNRRHQPAYDKELYKQRNLIERCFGKLKVHRRLATRYDRNDSHFRAFICLAAALLWLA